MREDLAEYYETNASEYASMHVIPGDEHFVALEYAASILETIRAESILDVGAGTGRALGFLKSRLPALKSSGVEPSRALRQLAGELIVLPATGERLPFADDSFDAVIATGVMHHVRDPERLLSEMVRVARKAVFISDANRFGQGSAPSRILKQMLWRTGCWSAFDWIRTRGKGYMESEGDGIYYSYSIYDSKKTLDRWGDRTFVIPTRGPAHGALGGLLSATHGLLVSVREPQENWAGLGNVDTSTQG